MTMVEKTSRNTYEYRGRSISTKPGKDKGSTILTIDDKEVRCYETESGVTCDDAMYMEFGSTQELAEHLIKQWGTAKIDRTPANGGHHQGRHK
jgi:hypothetical protein